MAKTNVSKGDLRRTTTKYGIKLRKERIALTSKGICYMCKHNWVKGRKTCIDCSSRQAKLNKLTGFRKVLREFGIDNPTDALETLAMSKGEDNMVVITALMNAIEASEYKGDVG